MKQRAKRTRKTYIISMLLKSIPLDMADKDVQRNDLLSLSNNYFGLCFNYGQRVARMPLGGLVDAAENDKNRHTENINIRMDLARKKL